MVSVDDQIAKRKAILLFFKEAEKDKFVKYDRYLKRVVRPLYELLHHRQKKSGFAVWFELLKLALEREGWFVRANDYAAARRHPHYPVGLVGFPELIDKWKLPNPAILGPSLYDHPMQAPRLMDDSRFKSYLVVAWWMYDMFRPIYGAACVQWYAGMDIEKWTDTAATTKDIDFLIYDKIRWNHDGLATELLEPIQNKLRDRGFRTETIRYRFYDHITYRRLLERSRAMVFLCEHETQGMAYQEAMASNVPILAWDNGYWLDPMWKQFSSTMIPASSVPLFSSDCGERFVDLAGFEPALDRFLDRLPRLNPRKYVLENLSMKRSAQIYSDLYFALLAKWPGATSAANLRHRGS
jgi:glycosyltransferase involved in cell wall biosynthesis